MGMWLFFIKMNNFGEQFKLETIEGGRIRRHVGYIKKKYVDKLNEVNSLDLNRYSVILPDKEILRPTNWHARTGHCLKLQNPAQCSLNNIFKIALNFFMVVNSKKRQTMILNTSRNIDVEPILITPNSRPLQFVTKAKLLGFILKEFLTMWDNTLTIESKSYKRIWVLKRLKNLGCNLNELTTAYIRLV